jgi:hypothetical protein
MGDSHASLDQGSNDPGTTEPKLGVNWDVGWCTGIWYGGDMIITGPAEVPF